MRILFYSTGDYERSYLSDANQDMHDIVFTPLRLVADTVNMARGFDAVSVFTSDELSAGVIAQLKGFSVKYIAIRATGFDHVDLVAAARMGISVSNVPGYSPESIAEHAVALMLALDRKLLQADKRVRRYNCSINGLMGFTLHGKTVGIIGAGKIGKAVARILHGFGCRLLAYDLQQNEAFASAFQVEYVQLEELCSRADIITLHTPLSNATKYLVNSSLIALMKKGVMLINTARGALVKTGDVIANLESGQIGYFGMDVYEKEKGLFFFDRSNNPPVDEDLKKLLSFPNTIITPHLAFATEEAIATIAETTMAAFHSWAKTGKTIYELT